MGWIIFAIVLLASIGLGLLIWANQGNIVTHRPINEWAFTHAHVVLPYAEVSKSKNVREFAGDGQLPDVQYEFAGKTRKFSELHKRTNTTSFMVVHKGKILAEEYPGMFAKQGGRFQLYSVSKSITSILVGIAIDKGIIASVADPVTKYASRVKGTAFEGRTIEDLLNMSSGVGEFEDWKDKKSAINRLETAVLRGGSVLELTRSLPEMFAAGAQFNYSTFDTNVLGWVLEEATGRDLADICQEWLWEPIGAEFDAFYFLTRKKPRMALGGASFNAATRDLARVGMMMASGGRVGEGKDSVQVVSEAWAKRSLGAGKEFLKVGNLASGGEEYYGYSNQWWTLSDKDGPFTGLGVHGQFLWVDPKRELVIVKTSAWNQPEDPQRDLETVTAFKALSEAL